MPVWAWVLIAIGAVVLIGAVIGGGALRRRTARLRERFGPEYERLQATRGRRETEKELSERERRREELDIRPLSASARERYSTRWQQVQARFVDAPMAAVREADDLIAQVMRERGYPVEDFEQRAAAVSVDHSDVVAEYRKANRLVISSDASTEDLRRAMQSYRALFDELVEPAADEPTAAEREEATAEVEAAEVRR
jgi:hypothetical protein